MIATNHIVDINKCQHATLYYQNQWEQRLLKLPKTITVRANTIGEHDKCYTSVDGVMVLINALQLAKELKLIDVWIPHCKFQLTANHSITYTGDKALSLWKAWQAKIFKKKE